MDEVKKTPFELKLQWKRRRQMEINKLILQDSLSKTRIIKNNSYYSINELNIKIYKFNDHKIFYYFYQLGEIKFICILNNKKETIDIYDVKFNMVSHDYHDIKYDIILSLFDNYKGKIIHNPIFILRGKIKSFLKNSKYSFILDLNIRDKSLIISNVNRQQVMFQTKK